MIDLAALFETLQPPSPQPGGAPRFAAHSIPGYEPHRVGRDAQGCPAILLDANLSNGLPVPPSIVLEHLTVQHGVRCRIDRPAGTSEYGLFTVLHCPSDDPALHSWFLRVAAPLVVSMGIAPTMSAVSEAVGKLVDLFRAMTEPPRKPVQGLWAEMFVISTAGQPALVIDAWHNSPEDRYDFNAGTHRLEVKSSANRVRQHHFRLEQLHPPAGTQALIVSLFVERAGGGLSLSSLHERLRSLVSEKPEALVRLDLVVAQTLGSSWRSALEQRFDLELAEQSIAFFEPAAIPRLGPVLPPGVTSVHFESDLTSAPQANLQAYCALGGLFRAALLRR